MARDATQTREALIRAGEHRFARDGVAGARLRHILREAGQGNDAAIGYHFGSRAGLLNAIVDKHMAIMEADRSRTRDDLADDDLDDLAGLVRMVVLPTADLLKSAEGRDFLRIIEQLASFSGVRAGHPAPGIRDTVLVDQLARLEDLIARDLTPAQARERVATLVTFLTATLAERARAIEQRPRQPLGHQAYVAEIVAMLAGALAA